MKFPQPLPLGLATLSSLPDLAATLGGIEPDAVVGYDTVEVLRAAQRQRNLASAALYAWVVEVAVRRPGSVSTVERLQVPHSYAVEEIRAALGISQIAAGKLLSAAWDATRRLPELHEAMAAGGLDEQRAAVFADWTEELSDEHAHAVCAELLPRAVLDADQQLPTHLLTREITRIAMALDPTWAERRFKEALRRRNVVGRMNRDGTADVSGQNLAPDRAAAICGRLDELARAAKRDGDPRRIGHLRTELFAGMLDGTYEGLSDTEIFTALAATRPGTHQPDAPASTSPSPTASGSGSDVESGLPDPAGKELVRCIGADRIDPATIPGPRCTTRAAARKPESPHAGVQLRIRMTTLLGLDRAPAELAGWTPIHADYALDLMSLMSAARWRYAITDDDGHLIGSGLINLRPKGWPRRAKRSRGTVDILVPASLLRDLILGPHDGLDLVDPGQFRTWHRVLAELADKLQHPRPLPDDSHKRMPGAGLRRVIELDKPNCIGVGCGRSSRTSQIDHRLDWAFGGATIDVNLAPECGPDHDLKTKGGWTLHTWQNTGYRWCTPLGRHYIVHVPPVLARIPAAMPDFWIEHHDHRSDPEATTDDEGLPWQVSRIWHPDGTHAPPPIDIVWTDPPPDDDDPPPF